MGQSYFFQRNSLSSFWLSGRHLKRGEESFPAKHSSSLHRTSGKENSLLEPVLLLKQENNTVTKGSCQGRRGKFHHIKNAQQGASLVVRGLRARLPMRGPELNPWSRRRPHAAGRPSPRTASAEPALWGQEQPEHRSSRAAPSAATREKPRKAAEA